MRPRTPTRIASAEHWQIWREAPAWFRLRRRSVGVVRGVQVFDRLAGIDDRVFGVEQLHKRKLVVLSPLRLVAHARPYHVIPHDPIGGDSCPAAERQFRVLVSRRRAERRRTADVATPSAMAPPCPQILSLTGFGSIRIMSSGVDRSGPGVHRPLQCHDEGDHYGPGSRDDLPRAAARTVGVR